MNNIIEWVEKNRQAKNVYRFDDSVRIGESWDRKNISRPETKRMYYGNLSHAHLTERDSSELFLIHPYLLYGDYNNTTTVERSNVEVFLERFGSIEGIYNVYGGYGTTGIAIALSVDDPEILEVLNDLENYPLIDEEHLSALELELQDEALNDYALDEFKAGLEDRFEIDLDEWPEDSLRNLFFECMERANEYWIHETPNLPYIRTKELVSVVELSDLLP